MKKIFFSLIVLLFLFWTGIYFFQEKLIFKPTPLSESFKYEFPTTSSFQEVKIPFAENQNLHGILFKSKERKGIVLSFHGNQGKLNNIGKRASLYTDLGYDIFYLNYRGFGKSNGSIKSEQQLFDDAQLVYDYLKKDFPEEKIILSGLSIGTGIATYLAAHNHPQQLILTAPYSSFQNLLQEKIKFVPSFLIKYKINTNEFLKDVKCPITIFHGENDKPIPISHSIYLKNNHKRINFIPFENFGHTDFLKEDIFKKEIEKLL